MDLEDRLLDICFKNQSFFKSVITGNAVYYCSG